ncbi:MAG: alpha-amylase [Bacteroidetes bacterium GWE2_29_8]|nr:MAG: alpha-amylase [Bacteroidetes bacterium GWE2_29_8]OFY19649.1 MAG: alpha-amylase [Bacteroidetes bacterium GWF2_29_10]
MRNICFYFQVHQPFRLKTYRFFDIGANHYYYDDYQNNYIMNRVANKCYLPTNQILLDLIKEYGTRFKVAFSISGCALDQFEMYAPDVLKSFQQLADTGCVEFIGETYAHSLSALKNKDEFEYQVKKHSEKIQALFGQQPKTFRNTELIYSDQIGAMVANLGFNTMLTEGAKHILGWKSPNFLYYNPINPTLKLLLKNFQLSDDIAFRFSQQTWGEWPLTTEKFVDWLNNVDQKEEIINLFMDYETFGEHQWPETGIFEFLKALPGKVFANSNYSFVTPSEATKKLQPVAPIHVPYPISWADEERDLTAWIGNELQDQAFDTLYALRDKVIQCDSFDILKDWKYLQTSDHFYYMCTKWFSDGDVHKYFNPYNSPYEAFINYMNIIADFTIRVEEKYNNTTMSNQDVQKNIEQIEIKQTRKQITSNTQTEDNRFYKIDQIIGFSDIKTKKVIKDCKPEVLAYAFMDMDEKIKEKFMKNITVRDLKVVKTIMENITKVNSSDITESRRTIENIMAKY